MNEGSLSNKVSDKVWGFKFDNQANLGKPSKES